MRRRWLSRLWKEKNRRPEAAESANARARMQPRTPEAAPVACTTCAAQRGTISKLMSAAGAECVSAPTDTESAPVEANSGMRSSVAPPEISIPARPRTRATASRMTSVGRLSIRMTSAPASMRLIDFVETLRFDFDGKGRLLRACPCDGLADASGEPHVVVLNQHGIEEPDAMIGRASHCHGVFFERAQRWRRLSGVEHGDASAGRVHERTGARRDAGETLQKIERGALPHQESARAAAHLGDLFASGTAIAIVLADRDLHLRIELAQRLERHIQSGDDAIGLGKEHAARPIRQRNCRVRRDIARPDVFIERAPHDVAVLARMQYDRRRSGAHAVPGQPVRSRAQGIHVVRPPTRRTPARAARTSSHSRPST